MGEEEELELEHLEKMSLSTYCVSESGLDSKSRCTSWWSCDLMHLTLVVFITSVCSFVLLTQVFGNAFFWYIRYFICVSFVLNSFFHEITVNFVFLLTCHYFSQTALRVYVLPFTLGNCVLARAPYQWLGLLQLLLCP